jgi:STE24 endopeptidase
MAAWIAGRTQRMLQALMVTMLVMLAVASPRQCLAQSAPTAGATSAPATAASNAHADTYTLSGERLSQAIRLARDENILHFAAIGWSILVLILLLVTGAVARLRHWAAAVTGRRWLQGCLFLPALLLITSLASLPLAAIGHHLARIYRLSVQGWAGWLGDEAKALALSLIVGTLLLSLVLLIIRRAPRRWWLWFWIASIPIELATVVVYPILVDPLFNHFEPLARTHPALVDQLERVVAKSGMQIPPQRMFLMKASEKYTGVNAYVTGLGASKRVVVWDTSIEKLPTNQILFVFGHEQGHYVLGHIWKGLVFYSAVSLVFFWIGALAIRRLIRRYGARWRIPSESDWAAAAVVLLVLGILLFFLEPIGNSFSRWEEHQADIYGQEVIHGIVADPQATASASFQALGEIWLEDPSPSRFIEFWTYSHPSVAHRMYFAAHYDPWRAGERPRYFAAAPAGD